MSSINREDTGIPYGPLKDGQIAPRRGRLSTICHNCVFDIDMINAICYDFSFDNDVSRQDGDSINFFAVTLVAGLRNARTIGRGATKGLVRCKFAAKNSENSEARDRARAVRRDDLPPGRSFRGEQRSRACRQSSYRSVSEGLHIVLLGGPLARGLGPRVGPGQSDFGEVPMLVIHDRIGN